MVGEKLKLFIVDTETTGTHPQLHGIIQFAGQIVIDGELVEPVEEKVGLFEKTKVSKKALEVNGYTLEDIKKHQSPQEAHEKLIDRMAECVNRYDPTDKFYWIGYNSRFDGDFVQKWFELCGDPYFFSWFHWPLIDVSNLAAIHFMNKERPENFKLMTVAKALDIEVDETKAHDALYDVKITQRIFERLLS